MAKKSKQTKKPKQPKQSPFDAIVKALDGVNATARVIGRRPSQVCQWRARSGRFPAELFFTLQEALRRRRRRCPRDAFDFEATHVTRAA